MIADRDAGHDDGAHANEAVAADISVRVEMTRGIMRQNDRSAFDERSITDMNAMRIGHVEIGAKGNSCISADIVFREFTPEECAQ